VKRTKFDTGHSPPSSAAEVMKNGDTRNVYILTTEMKKCQVDDQLPEDRRASTPNNLMVRNKFVFF
jgi:hypothetical protein